MIVQKHIFVYMNDEICMGTQILIFILIDLSYMQVLCSDIIGTLSLKEIIFKFYPDWMNINCTFFYVYFWVTIWNNILINYPFPFHFKVGLILEEAKKFKWNEYLQLWMYLTSVLQMVELVLPPTPVYNDIVMEIQSAIGGRESMLFAYEIYEMYKNLAFLRGWTFIETIERGDNMMGSKMQKSKYNIYSFHDLICSLTRRYWCKFFLHSFTIMQET